jgi:methylated-DNA-[protein]-cysteine S-methyltransferase
MLFYKHMISPVGPLTLVADGAALVAVLWPNDRPFSIRFEKMDKKKEDREHPVLNEVARQLTEYFRGDRRAFQLPLHLGGTPFQKEVWQALRRIPYGHTSSYGQLARAIGRGGAWRAVGLANSRNPLPIIIPCHRVIGVSGRLTGFAGGLETKAKLLALEGARARRVERKDRQNDTYQRRPIHPTV